VVEDSGRGYRRDGGNNDFAFLRAGLTFVVADALRPDHELNYHPGETNFRAADVIVVNKVAQASHEAVWRIRRHAAELNPAAHIVEADLEIAVDRPEAIRGRRALVVEDGPTLTHGGMSYGAGTLAARRCEAAEWIDPRPFAVGFVADALRAYPHVGHVLPALGYSPAQCDDLRRTIAACQPDVIVDASLGNSPNVAMRQYLMTTDEHFAAAVAGREVLAERRTKATQKATQQLHAGGGREPQTHWGAVQETPDWQGFATPCMTLPNDPVAGKGSIDGVWL
jgi:predicted GTPase